MQLDRSSKCRLSQSSRASRSASLGTFGRALCPQPDCQFSTGWIEMAGQRVDRRSSLAVDPVAVAVAQRELSVVFQTGPRRSRARSTNWGSSDLIG